MRYPVRLTFVMLLVLLCLSGFQTSAPVSLITINTDGEIYNIQISDEFVGDGWVTEFLALEVRAPAWSNDGKSLAFVSGNDIMVESADGTLLSITSDEQPWKLSWSPDSSRIAYTTNQSYPNPFGVQVANLETGHLQWITDFAAGCCVDWVSNNQVIFVERPSSKQVLAHVLPNDAVSYEYVVDESKFFSWAEHNEIVASLPLAGTTLETMVVFEVAWNADHTLLAVYMSNQNTSHLDGGPIVKVVIFEVLEDGSLDIRMIHTGKSFGGFAWNPIIN